MKLKPVHRWTAYHEVGHAVLRYCRTGAGTALEVGVDGNGFSYGSGEVIRRSDAIEIALAGPLAEARVRKASSVAMYLTCGLQDWKAAVSLAEEMAAAYEIDKKLPLAEADENERRLHELCVPSAHSLLIEAEKKARFHLRMCWPAVERLADVALTRRYVKASKVSEICAVYC